MFSPLLVQPRAPSSSIVSCDGKLLPRQRPSQARRSKCRKGELHSGRTQGLLTQLQVHSPYQPVTCVPWRWAHSCPALLRLGPFLSQSHQSGFPSHFPALSGFNPNSPLPESLPREAWARWFHPCLLPIFSFISLASLCHNSTS